MVIKWPELAIFSSLVTKSTFKIRLTDFPAKWASRGGGPNDPASKPPSFLRRAEKQEETAWTD